MTVSGERGIACQMQIEPVVFQIFGALAEFERNLIRKRNELAQRATPNLAIPSALVQYSQRV
jgi:hypothetical protein